MFALIEAAKREKGTFAERLRRSVSGYRGVIAYSERILSLPLFHVVIEQAPPESRRAQKRIDEAVNILLRRNITRLCFREDFLFREKFLNAGFCELDDGFLRRLMAGEIAAKAAEGENKTAVLYSRRFSSLESKALFDLCLNFRYVIAESERGGRDVFRRAEREFGIAPIEKLTEPGLKSADVAVLFAAPGRKLIFPQKCVVLALEPEVLNMVECAGYISKVEFSFPREVIGRIPDGYPREAIVSEATSFGLVKTDRIKVKNVETWRKP
ncbi:MAG: hypothetical protein AB7C97_05590 [Oscillospiraceae bacterium]